jgi:hypothetical protein
MDPRISLYIEMPTNWNSLEHPHQHIAQYVLVEE